MRRSARRCVGAGCSTRPAAPLGAPAGRWPIIRIVKPCHTIVKSFVFNVIYEGFQRFGYVGRKTPVLRLPRVSVLP